HRAGAADGTGAGRGADRVPALAALLPAGGARMTFRCSELSLELEEPLAATATFAQQWELVERQKPWGRDHGLSRPDAKVLLVRRAGAARPEDGRRYLVCTNSARDPCCGRLGAGVAAALERARPGRAYEC